MLIESMPEKANATLLWYEMVSVYTLRCLVEMKATESTKKLTEGQCTDSCIDLSFQPIMLSMQKSRLSSRNILLE